MVERCEKIELVAVDLDGTLITGNSLHLYIRCGLRDALRHGRLVSACGIVSMLMARRLRLCSHLCMKRRMMRLIRPGDSLRRDFIRRFEPMRSTITAGLIADALSKGKKVLLATAAPEVYIPWIWPGDYVATDSLSLVECRGEEKLRRVLAYADSNGLVLTEVITDHHDDLPLLSYPGLHSRHLISPSPSTLDRLSDLQFPCQIHRP